LTEKTHEPEKCKN